MNIKNALLPLVLVSTLMHSFPSRAQEDHAIYGFYTDSCGQWLEARRAGGLEEIKYSIWVLGFVSGVDSRVTR
ncbi:MAG: hypothetical protein IPG06_11730 [Haliea sp.]|nr:hypothetical protein [Haliea sp.]